MFWIYYIEMQEADNDNSVILFSEKSFRDKYGVHHARENKWISLKEAHGWICNGKEFATEMKWIPSVGGWYVLCCLHITQLFVWAGIQRFLTAY